MTISYAGNFAKLLFRWKGSLWKAIWLEALIFLTIYYIINFNYRLWMVGKTKSEFEALVLSVDRFTKVSQIFYNFTEFSTINHWNWGSNDPL